MANQALNNNQLEAMLMPKIRIAVDYVVQKIWNENREIVRQVVYEAYTPKQYERTGEFKEAWDTDTSVSGNKAHGEFKYNPESLTIGSNGQHSSIFDGASSRDYLVDIIYQGLSGAIYEKGYAKDSVRFQDQTWAQKRNAWEVLERKVGVRKIKQWMKEGFNKAGLNVQSHGMALGINKW